MSSPLTDLELVYLLTDRQGQAYKEVSADVITLPSKTRVAGFRKTVQAENPNKLGAVDSSDLKVYKNRAAFNERKEPLGPLSLLNESFGTDEQNALIVVVPSPSSGDMGTLNLTSPFSTPGILAKLTEFVQFAASFDGAPKAETVFTIPSFEDIFGGLLGNTPKFFVRPAYEELFQTIMEQYNEKKKTHRPKFLVIGTPGIGKSVFGIYCVLRLLQLKKNIAYRGLKSDFFIYFTARSDGTYEYSTCLNKEILGHSYFKLFDGAEQTGDFSPFPREEASFLFSSPTDRNFNEFKKNCSTFCLEPWSFKELNIFSHYTEKSTDWTEKYSIVGGVPRHVFSDDKPEYLRAKIDHAIPSHRQRLEDSIKNAIEFRILHFWQAESSDTQYLQFATPDIENMIMAAFQIKNVNELKRLLLTSDPELQSWRGKRFEDLNCIGEKIVHDDILPLPGVRGIAEAQRDTLPLQL
jgi:hypothetical protein